jgi:hypothetical protein
LSAREDYFSCSEEQARAGGNEVWKRNLSIGEITGNKGQMEHNRSTDQLSVVLRNMVSQHSIHSCSDN